MEEAGLATLLFFIRMIIMTFLCYEELLCACILKMYLTDTPYGTVIFFPLTKKIMRHCFLIDGDVHVFIQYLDWLKQQWRERNPSIDCYELR
ncbi:hypothetical protein EIM95_21435 [Salmonella enterica]|nr:hypothetical protein [Salmonella enterica]